MTRLIELALVAGIGLCVYVVASNIHACIMEDSADE